MGGFEGADHLNSHGAALDMARANGHIDRVDEDYAAAAALGLRTLRESIGWRLAEPATGRFDFARLRALAQAARRQGVQVVWTLMHYGTPADVDLRDDRMIDRFARFAAAVADTLAPLSDGAPVYNLINVIGFLAWAVSETAQIHPYRQDLAAGSADSTASSGYEVKRRLARAVLAGIDAVRAIDPRARFLHVEPVVHVAPPLGRPDLAEAAARIAAYQWQAWDLIGGLVEPELGGSLDALDLLGINHYHSGQWEVCTEERLWWHLRDPRRRPLSRLLANAWQRYRRPMLIAETGHVGSGRAAWLHEVADEVIRARASGVPVGGICLYPLVDRPDWNEAGHWHHSGLWDVDPGSATPMSAHADRDRAPPFARTLAADCASALAACQRRLPYDAGAEASAPLRPPQAKRVDAIDALRVD
jgi:beta-glucosidase/6-phospho-beta-glucosidase/beta-galactosidase